MKIRPKSLEPSKSKTPNIFSCYAPAHHTHTHNAYMHTQSCVSNLWSAYQTPPSIFTREATYLHPSMKQSLTAFILRLLKANLITYRQMIVSVRMTRKRCHGFFKMRSNPKERMMLYLHVWQQCPEQLTLLRLKWSQMPFRAGASAVHPPKANDAFPPILDSPAFQNFSESGKIFPTFLVVDYEFRIPPIEFRIPLFSLKCYILSPTISDFFLFPLCLLKFSPLKFPFWFH